jgi:hypothetical protein
MSVSDDPQLGARPDGDRERTLQQLADEDLR